ncbi:Hypothetical_protein [Hexamita inflata]|uniref:Hypothetical_protein n=1 Tax=Hexamita inflata TaxID=28002 RepID=A0AA86PDK9_9EUKA|nr:Hypothetical protein HINF_LOCUS23486 [Hexamita inflata]
MSFKFFRCFFQVLFIAQAFSKWSASLNHLFNVVLNNFFNFFQLFFQLFVHFLLFFVEFVQFVFQIELLILFELLNLFFKNQIRNVIRVKAIGDQNQLKRSVYLLIHFKGTTAVQSRGVKYFIYIFQYLSGLKRREADCFRDKASAV